MGAAQGGPCRGRGHRDRRSPLRIDDETKGIPLVSDAKGPTPGELNKPRSCYICKRDYTLVDAFYH